MVIVFFEVEESTHAAQGGSASGQAGYEAWAVYKEGNGMAQDFLGFSSYDDVERHIGTYKALGETVWMAPLDSQDLYPVE